MQLNTVSNTVARSLFFVAREGGEAMKDDPALALRASATLLQSPVLDGVSDPIKNSTATAIVPIIRGALLATNAVQCYRTFHRPDAGWIARSMDSLRVATDMVGVAGACAMVFVPKYAQLGLALVGGAYAADLVSHAYRAISHVDGRIKVWETELNASQHQGTDGPPAGPSSNAPPAPNAPKTLPSPAA